MSQPHGIDPTNFGPAGVDQHREDQKKLLLEKKAHIYETITSDERLLDSYQYAERQYKSLLDKILSDTTPAEEIPLLRAQAQVHKEYADRFGRIKREGEKAIKTLKETP